MEKENPLPISNTEKQQQFQGLTFTGNVFLHCIATFNSSPMCELAGVEACLRNLFPNWIVKKAQLAEVSKLACSVSDKTISTFNKDWRPFMDFCCFCCGKWGMGKKNGDLRIEKRIEYESEGIFVM